MESEESGAAAGVPPVPAAGAARVQIVLDSKYPGVLMAIYDGRLSQRAVLMLAPHLTPANANELVAVARDKTCFELQVVLAERFPRPDLPERISAIAAPAAPMYLEPAPGRVFATIPDEPVHRGGAPAPELAAQRVEAPRAKVTPLAPQRFGFQFTGDEETHELYEYYRALMSDEVPSGEMAQVFKRALEVAVAQVEKRKFALTDRPGKARGSDNPRHIPPGVKREVFVRDQGKCAFVSESGKRCGSRRRLNFDHIDLVARGGKPTVDKIRLLWRAHNQYTAENALGAEFMEQKRAEARQCRCATTQ